MMSPSIRLTSFEHAELAQPPQRVGAAPGQQAMNRIALLQQELREVRAVLPGDAGDQC